MTEKFEKTKGVKTRNDFLLNERINETIPIKIGIIKKIKKLIHVHILI